MAFATTAHAPVHNTLGLPSSWFIQVRY
jgi:hypothetical protein